MADETDEPAWHQMERHVEELLRVHPLLSGLTITVLATISAIEAEVGESAGILWARYEREGWWSAGDSLHGYVIADWLAKEIASQWRDMHSPCSPLVPAE